MNDKEQEAVEGLMSLLTANNKVVRVSGRLLATKIHQMYFDWGKAEQARGTRPMETLQASFSVFSSFLVGYVMMVLKDTAPESMGEDLGEALGKIFQSQFEEAYKMKKGEMK